MKWVFLSIALLIGAGAAGWYFRAQLPWQPAIAAVQSKPDAGAPAAGDQTGDGKTGTKKLRNSGGGKGDGSNGGGGNGGGRNGGGSRGPAVVVVAQVVLKNAPTMLDVSGTLESITSIAIKPRLDSQITEVTVAEGALVEAGAPLFTLDSRALDAQIVQLDAQIAKDQAQLDFAKADLSRATDLVTKKITAPAAKDQASMTAKVAAAQLALDNAQRQSLVISKSFTRIVAPVRGRIGSIPAKLGASVRNGDLLATLNQIDPIYVRFSVPQEMIGDIRAAIKNGSAAVEVARPGGVTEGKIAFMENAVDATGSLLFKANLPNTAEEFWPGQLVKVSLKLGEQKNVVVVPSGAVLMGQSGAYVIVVEKDAAKIKPVVIDRVVGDDTVLASGLAAGDALVIDGQSGLSDGAAVKVAGGAGGKMKDTGAAETSAKDTSAKDRPGKPAEADAVAKTAKDG